MPNKKTKRRLNITFRLAIILIICAVIVYLFPKIGNFQYEYQKGMSWRYETLYAPFDFPIHKTEEELNEERKQVIEEEEPIFQRNNQTANVETEKFQTALHSFENATTRQALQQLAECLQGIYNAGILQVPEKMDAERIRTVRIIENNLAESVEFSKVYTLKKAYSVLSQKVNESSLPKSTKERILSLNLNNYLQENLEFDLNKTLQAQAEALKNISLTQGMVQQGDLIISKRELVTAEKEKLLN